MSKKNKKTVSSPQTITSLHPFFDRFEKQSLWHIVILVIVPFFIYIKAVGFEFINMDDTAIITNHLEFLTHWSNIGQAFKTDVFLSNHGILYRPIQTISFMLDAWISGPRPWMYHLSNIVYHLLTVISLYFLLKYLRLKNLTAFLLSMFFAIHPLLTSAIAWLPSRANLLAGLWSVWLFITFIRYFQTKKKIHLFLHAVFFLLAVFTKEASVIFPLLFALYYFAIINERSYKELFPFIIIWVMALVLFFIAIHTVVAGMYTDNVFGTTPFLNNIPAIADILAKIFIPVNLSPLPLFENNFTTIGTLLFLLLALLMLRKAIKKEWLPATGFVWFILLLAASQLYTVSNSKFLLQYLEREAYLPMIGFVIMLASLLNEKLQQAAPSKWVWLSLIVILIFIPVASVYSDSFKDTIAFFGRAADINNPGAYTKRGEEYYGKRNFSDAMSDFSNAIDISNSQYALPFYDRGKTESIYTKDHQAAEADMSQAILLDTSFIEAYIDRADERLSLQNIRGAWDDLSRAIQLDSNNARIYYVQGKAMVGTRNFKEAVNHFSKAIQLDSFYIEAYGDRALAYYELKQYQDAINDCNKAISLNRGYFTAYYNKAMVYYETGNPAATVKLLDTTLALADNFYLGYFYRGMAKKQLNDMKGACNDWQESVSLGFTMAEDTIKRYCK